MPEVCLWNPTAGLASSGPVDLDIPDVSKISCHNTLPDVLAEIGQI